MDWLSWGFGLLAGVVVALIGKGVDIWQRGRVRELDIAALVGELRAGFAGLQLRQQVVERRLDKLSERINEMSRRIDDDDASNARKCVVIAGGCD